RRAVFEERERALEIACLPRDVRLADERGGERRDVLTEALEQRACSVELPSRILELAHGDVPLARLAVGEGQDPRIVRRQRGFERLLDVRLLVATSAQAVATRFVYQGLRAGVGPARTIGHGLDLGGPAFGLLVVALHHRDADALDVARTPEG